MKAMSIGFAFLTLFVCTVGFARAKTAQPAEPLYQGKTAHQWYRIGVRHRVERDTARTKAGQAIRAGRRFHRVMLHQPSSLEALRLAAIAYRVSFRLLYRIASCESTGTRTSDSEPASERTLYAHAKNRSSSASGLAQFLYPSSWRSTPYGGENVFSPYANALALASEVAADHTNWQWAASRGCWS